MYKKNQDKKKIELELGYEAPRWTGEIADCSMPMTFDQYSKCGYDCIYCFARFQKTLGGAKKTYLNDCRIKSVDIKKVREIFLLKKETQFSELIRQKKVLQWGGMADPFCLYEKKFGVGLKLLNFFKRLNYPICFSTKGVWWTKDIRYIELFQDQLNWNTKFSIITNNEKYQKLVEPAVPSTMNRFKAMNRISKLNNGGVTLRLRPFIIGITDYKKGHIELIRKAVDNGAEAISTEFFCVENRSTFLKEALTKLSLELGWNVLAFYKKYSYSTGYYRLNREIKRPYIDDMQNECDKLGLRFYVSDAHFKERCHNGSCCGLPPDWNYCKGQWTEALQIAKKEGKVYWSNVSKHLSYAKKFLYRKATWFNTKSPENRAKFYNHTMYDYLRWVWNNPKNGQSPYTMYEGILKPCGKDTANNLVYRYVKNKE